MIEIIRTEIESWEPKTIHLRTTEGACLPLNSRCIRRKEHPRPCPGNGFPLAGLCKDLEEVGPFPLFM